MAALKRFCVISGGPGTGKTTTVVRILALLLEQARGRLRIALAAPTGKAAARMQDAIRASLETLRVDVHIRDVIPVEAATIHRLLGFRAGPSNSGTIGTTPCRWTSWWWTRPPWWIWPSWPSWSGPCRNRRA